MSHDFTEDTLVHLTRLCRIECPPEERVKLLQDLKKIVALISELDEVDTSDALPCTHVIDGTQNVLRDDVVKEVMDRSLFLANAPAHVGGMIRVPTVLKS